MPDDERFVTKEWLALELRSFKNEMRVLVAIVAIFIKFDLPAPVTITAVVAVTGKVLWSGLAARLGA